MRHNQQEDKRCLAEVRHLALKNVQPESAWVREKNGLRTVRGVSGRGIVRKVQEGEENAGGRCDNRAYSSGGR